MKIQFDNSQAYQINAIQSVVSAFSGQPNDAGQFQQGYVGNRLLLSREQLLVNIQNVQVQNGIPISKHLVPSLSNDGQSTFCPLNLTVEMETGTGKTYTFIRTIYELNKAYGFKKFVIVVPSIAIREGIIKSLQITHEHFQTLYGNVPINHLVYEGRNLSALRNFSSSNAIQILVINIDSFTKDTNIINTWRETGQKPIESIQNTNPIVIVDEPQNMETDIRRSAIHNLNPLCTLRYSATHRNLYNLVYSLNPVQAYDLGLVKQIEVDSVRVSLDPNTPYIKLVKFVQGKQFLRARLAIHVETSSGTKEEKEVVVDVGDNLFNLSGNRSVYASGYVVNEIYVTGEYVEFSNGTRILLNQEIGKASDEVLRYQMERAIHHHFEKEVKYIKGGSSFGRVKVLTLFFIDRVFNYRERDGDLVLKGKYARWFEEIFRECVFKLKSDYPDIDSAVTSPDWWVAEKSHGGYFSQDKGIEKDTKGNTKSDQDTYGLIMRDKERLLGFDEPMRFIFSHSALREGWDNPNVFQICTLNESKSDLKKRQEIGRGLRLAVDHNGQRVKDGSVNVLTFITTEAYGEFAEALQKEIQEETGVDFAGRLRDANQKGYVKSNILRMSDLPYFQNVWETIGYKKYYCVEFDTKCFVQSVIQEFEKLPLLSRPILSSETARLGYSATGVVSEGQKLAQKAQELVPNYSLPDPYEYIKQRTNITRVTIFEILTIIHKRGGLDGILISPIAFLDNLVRCIHATFCNLLADSSGVKYQAVDNGRYEVSLSNEGDDYLMHLPGNWIGVDYEEQATDQGSRLFFKFPYGFKIETPLGQMTPQWAIASRENQSVYFGNQWNSDLKRLKKNSLGFQCLICQ